MSQTVADFLSRLQTDAWRIEAGFSQEIQSANQGLFASSSTPAQCMENIQDWLQKYQPCVFGRIAAKLGLLSYCILMEADLQGSDEHIREKIQLARTQWTREGFEGKKSGFVILAISPTITQALPNDDMKRLACKICSLYLRDDASTDEIYLDDIFLEKPGTRKTTWKWNTGINYFCAQGDKRWWHDHRIPGGMAFSINSVGHMVKSGMLGKSMIEIDRLLGAPDEGWVSSKIDSPANALQYAMLTIDNALDAISGKATELLPLSESLSELPIKNCPVKLPNVLLGKNFCEYRGYYHTDYTLPSEYFSSAVERPPNLQPHRLDFTYLFDASVDNPDHERMFIGQQIRIAPGDTSETSELAVWKSGKALETEVNIEDNTRLVKALAPDRPA